MESGLKLIAAIVSHADFLYRNFLMIAFPLLFLICFLTRARNHWRKRDFIIVALTPPIWLEMTIHINRNKSLANLAIEPFMLGFLIAMVFALSVFVERKRPKLKFPFLLISSLIVIVLVQLFVPALPE